MISLDAGPFRFQLRAAAVVIDEGSVLLHRLEGDGFWALPGGRVEAGEDARSTVLREMREELAESVECGPLLYVVENFFSHAGRPNHEIGMYFAVRMHAASAVLADKSRTHWGTEGGRRLEFRWFPVARLATVELHPSFLRQSLLAPSPHCQHIVQQG